MWWPGREEAGALPVGPESEVGQEAASVKLTTEGFPDHTGRGGAPGLLVDPECYPAKRIFDWTQRPVETQKPGGTLFEEQDHQLDRYCKQPGGVDRRRKREFQDWVATSPEGRTF